MFGCWGGVWLLGGVFGCWGGCLVVGGGVWLLGGCLVVGGGVWLLGGKKSSTALIKKISLSTVLTAFDDLKNGFLSFAVLEGRLRGAGLCGLSSKSMFTLDVSLQLHAMRPVLQTVTIGHATFVRDIY